MALPTHHGAAGTWCKPLGYAGEAACSRPITLTGARRLGHAYPRSHDVAASQLRWPGHTHAFSYRGWMQRA